MDGKPSSNVLHYRTCQEKLDQTKIFLTKPLLNYFPKIWLTMNFLIDGDFKVQCLLKTCSSSSSLSVSLYFYNFV